MPKCGTLTIEPTQNKIRDVFLDRIVKAKGLSRESELISGILMPTPAAMMAAMELLANGTQGESGIGDLLAVDVGGATTDIYSIADGMPANDQIVYKGLPEPKSKRTVEGDIGMRYSIHGFGQAAGIDRVAALSDLPPERALELVDRLAQFTDTLPDTDELTRLDFALASLAVETAVQRHCGTLEEAYTMMGLAYVQTGKDLRKVRQMVVTGGSLIHTSRTGEIAASGLQNPQKPMNLMPEKAKIWIDRRYILASMGLLAQTRPQMALRLMKKELIDGNKE